MTKSVKNPLQDAVVFLMGRVAKLEKENEALKEWRAKILKTTNEPMEFYDPDGHAFHCILDNWDNSKSKKD